MRARSRVRRCRSVPDADLPGHAGARPQRGARVLGTLLARVHATRVPQVGAGAVGHADLEGGLHRSRAVARDLPAEHGRRIAHAQELTGAMVQPQPGDLECRRTRRTGERQADHDRGDRRPASSTHETSPPTEDTLHPSKPIVCCQSWSIRLLTTPGSLIERRDCVRPSSRWCRRAAGRRPAPRRDPSRSWSRPRRSERSRSARAPTAWSDRSGARTRPPARSSCA